VRTIYLDCVTGEGRGLLRSEERPRDSPRYNIAPTQPVLAIAATADNAGRQASLYRWGLIPAWSNDIAIGYRLINRCASLRRTWPTSAWPSTCGPIATACSHSCATPGLDATNWRAELAIRFGVILRKVWGGSRAWVGARAQAVLMSVWRTCWQHGRLAPDFLSQLLRGAPTALVLPP
jgi:hypothetical protein